MIGRRSALYCLALAGGLALATPASPQEPSAPCRLCSAGEEHVENKPEIPISLDVAASLDFDRLILANPGSGSAELGPEGIRTVSGSVASIGARAMAGEVVVQGEPGRHVRVILPGSIELYGQSGGSIHLVSIRSDLPPLPRLDGNGNLRFRFGGLIRIIGDVDGEFRGNVPVEVDYL